MLLLQLLPLPLAQHRIPLLLLYLRLSLRRCRSLSQRLRCLLGLPQLLLQERVHPSQVRLLAGEQRQAPHKRAALKSDAASELRLRRRVQVQLQNLGSGFCLCQQELLWEVIPPRNSVCMAG